MDEKTIGVSGECSFASTVKSEKEGNITLLNAYIGKRSGEGVGQI